MEAPAGNCKSGWWARKKPRGRSFHPPRGPEQRRGRKMRARHARASDPCRPCPHAVSIAEFEPYAITENRLSRCAGRRGGARGSSPRRRGVRGSPLSPASRATPQSVLGARVHLCFVPRPGGQRSGSGRRGDSSRPNRAAGGADVCTGRSECIPCNSLAPSWRASLSLPGRIRPDKLPLRSPHRRAERPRQAPISPRGGPQSL